MRRWFLTAALVASCCPSVWLSVTVRDRAPRVAVPLPRVATPAFVYPPHLDNRFDVLTGGVLDPAALDYRDAVDARNEPVGERTRAALALDAIVAAYGAAAPALDVVEHPTCYPGTPACSQHGCDDVSLPGVYLPEAPVAIRIDLPGGAVHRAVATCEGIAAAGDPEDLQRPCGDPASGGSYLALATPFPDPHGTVQVCLSSTLRLSETALTFVHLSDVQLRDSDVKLGDAEVSQRLDWLVQSFEHDEDQEFYNPYLLEAMVATINGIVAQTTGADRPRLLVHTGDAVDAGVMSEVARFHEIMDRLLVPWFNALGNHDILVFGNLLPSPPSDEDGQCVTARSIAAPYRTYTRYIHWAIPNKLCIRSRIECEHCLPGEGETFVAGDDHASSRQRFIQAMGHPFYAAVAQLPPPAPPAWQLEYEVAGRTYTVREAPSSFLHGFDVSSPDHPDDGYYAFATPITIAGQPRHVVFVVLNTEDLEPGEGGNAGRIGAAQLAWLRATLDAVRGGHDLVFVFGHHAPSDIKAPGGVAVHDLLAATPNVVAYFFGHKHRNGLCRHDDGTSTCKGFWEIEGGSLIEFPQEARLIRLKSIGSGLAFLEMTTFIERLEPDGGQFEQFVAYARRGAERDHCRTHDDARCSEDLRVRRDDARHTDARLFFRLP